MSPSTPDTPPDPTPPRGSTVPLDARFEAPVQIGPYRIREQLGEGGMGVVYLAEQTEPVRRQVAIKIIKLGMDTRDVVARFDAEKQALAMMSHPNIAKVFDAGSTESGRPYFVMEYVRGEPITGYCDRHRLSTRQRLELFVEVCAAIHHAHQKGIIHRDVKPSNILVTVRDGRAAPMVIDFGVAKATNQRLTEATVFTEHGRLIGTPAYMSPEQAEMTTLDVDTTTDVYSLGVVLYELLTGSVPLDTTALREAGLSAMHRMIRETEPPAPSTRISLLTPGVADEVARARATRLEDLRKQVRGELDWITMKAIEKSRDRRYQSASEFAAEIERYLRGDPVLAGPPGARYVLSKLVRRYRARFVTAGLVAAALVVGLVGTLAMYDQAVQARQEAVRAGYVASIQASASSLQLGHVLEARRQLLGCPEPLRGWEWTYLWSRLDDSRRVLDPGIGDIGGLALDPTGQYLAAAGPHILDPEPQVPATIVVFDLETGEVVRTILEGTAIDRGDGGGRRFGQGSYSLDYSADGGRLLSAGAGNAVRIWNLETGQAELVLDDVREQITVARFSPDGARFAVGFYRIGARVYDARDGAQLFEADAGTTVSDLAFDAGGDLLTGSSERGVRRWSQDGQAVGALEENLQLPARGVALSRDGSSAAIQTAGVVRSFDLQSMEEVPEHTLSGVEGDMVIGIAPDAGAVSGGTLAGTIRLRPRGDLPRELRGHEAMLSAILHAPDGQGLITGGTDGTIRFWDVARRPATVEVPEKQGYRVVDLSPDGRWVVYGSDAEFVVWDRDRKADVVRTDLPGRSRYARAWIDRGSRHALFADPGDSTISETCEVWSLPDGVRIGSIPQAPIPDLALVAAPNRIVTVFWDPDPEVENLIHRGVEIVDPVTGQSLGRFQTPNWVWSFAVSAARGQCAAGSSEGRLWILDLDDGSVVHELSAQIGQITALAFSPDGSRLVSGSTEAAIHVWDTATGELLATIPVAGRLGVIDFTWSDDGTQLAALTAAREVQIYDAAHFERMLSIELEWTDQRPILAFQPEAGTLHVDLGAEVRVLGPVGETGRGR